MTFERHEGSWELFRIYKSWIDSVLQGMEPGARQNILVVALGTPRLKWGEVEGTGLPTKSCGGT
jgi:hypothetical protein